MDLHFSHLSRVYNIDIIPFKIHFTVISTFTPLSYVFCVTKYDVTLRDWPLQESRVGHCVARGAHAPQQLLAV